MATSQKRGNSYLISVSLGYDSNGKQRRETLTWKPDANMTNKQIDKELKRQKILIEEKCRNGLIGNNENLKLYNFIPIYLEHIKKNISPTNTQKRIIDMYIIPELGHLKLKDIKPLQIQRFVDKLCNTAVHKKNNSNKLSNSTVRRYYTVLHSIISLAFKLGYINVDPTAGNRITLPKVNEEETQIFTLEELDILTSCLENEPLQFKLLIHMALCTGCRRGELLGLKWSDIDFKNEKVKICRSVYKNKGQDIQYKNTKTGKSRVITLPRFCINLLKEYKKEQNQYRLSLGDNWQGCDAIFIQNNGKIMHPTTPSAQFKKFLNKYNIPLRRFHSLRHTSATILMLNNISEKNIGARLGHSQAKTTHRYVHAVERLDKQASSVFDDIYSSNTNIQKRA